MGRVIRHSLDVWEGRVCDRIGVPHASVWGNHDGILLSPDLLASLDDITKMKLGVAKVHPGDWAIGEALAKGSVATPMIQYEKDLAAGKLEVRVFEVFPRKDEDVYAAMKQASKNWTKDIEGHGYDYWAYIGLILRAYLGWNVDTGSRTKFWCTEGVSNGYLASPPQYDILQDSTPTPMHVEHALGTIPRPKDRVVTMREVTDLVMC